MIRAERPQTKSAPAFGKRLARTSSGWSSVAWTPSQAFDSFLSTYEAKYPKATERLAKDQDTLLTFYDFPAEHWLHIRTTNPIESIFATVRLRTTKTRGCVSRSGILTMVFKLTKTAEQNWRTLKGHALLAQVAKACASKTVYRGYSENRRLMLPYPTFDKNSVGNGETHT